jgi:hypothetical protein
MRIFEHRKRASKDSPVGVAVITARFAAKEDAVPSAVIHGSR